jgi:hypothetical protein
MAERAERYDEAASHLREAAEAYGKALAAPAVAQAPPARLPEPPQAPRESVAVPRAEPPAPAPLPPAPEGEQAAAKTDEPQPELNAREVAERTLGELRRALEAEDIDALQRAWVTLSPSDARNFRRWFDLMRDIEVVYAIRSVDDEDGKVSVNVSTTYRSFNESSDKPETQSFSQILELEQRDGRWVVVANRQ